MNLSNNDRSQQNRSSKRSARLLRVSTESELTDEPKGRFRVGLQFLFRFQFSLRFGARL